ncbi:MAG TPA: SH3 domain-containing protein [Smithellaceae bacterium]|nr:SH3 domain-containing protein [Smithellaceae bacterium]
MFHYISRGVCLILLIFLMFSATAIAQRTMSVQVKEGQLRATPSHLGKIVARANYGSQVMVLEERGAWKRVSPGSGKKQGWMHNTALTSKRIALRAGQSNVGTSVTRDEIALAGKGFNEEVEAQYRKSKKNLDYTWINKMEALKVSQEQMEDFISGGRLTLGGEGGMP